MDTTTPAIFKRVANKKNSGPRWMVSLGRGGIVFDGTVIKEYPTVTLAFEDMKKLMGVQ